eukprot:gene9218-1504_t
MAILSALHTIDQRLESSKEMDALSNYASKLLDPIISNVTSGNLEPRKVHSLALIQGSILDAACRYNASIRTKVSQLFQDFVNTGSLPHPDILQAVLSEGIRAELAGAQNAIWNLYNSTSIAAIKRTCLRALASSRSIPFINSFIREAFSEQGRVREQDRSLVLRYIASDSLAGANAVWEFIKANWTDVGSPRVLETVASRFVSKSALRDLQKTLNAHTRDLDTTSQQTLVERVEAQVEWRQQNAELITKWMQEAHI